MSEPTISEVYRLLQDMKRDDLAEIKGHLATLNGRTRDNEEDIAVLRDRSDAARSSAATWGAFAGGVISAVVGGAFSLLRN